MNKWISVQRLMHKLYSNLVFPAGLVAIALIMTQNIPLVSVVKNQLEEKGVVPPVRFLAFQEARQFRKFMAVRTPVSQHLQCVSKPKISLPLPGSDSLY